MRVAFRADSSSLIGTGHLMRCLTLAGELAARGATTVFACRPHEGHVAARVSEQGHALRLLPGTRAPVAWTGPAPAHAGWLGTDWSEDARDSAAALLDDAPADWLVVDHYAIDARWEQALRDEHARRHGNALRILAIDDLADRPHACDLLLDQNLQTAGRYDGLLAPGGVALLGPRYALVRPDFARARADAAQQTRRDVLIYFGSGASGALLADAIEAFDGAAPAHARAHVLLNPGAAVPSALNAACDRLGPARCRVHVGAASVARLMGACGLSIGAAGTTTWERCTMALPTVLVSVADNQVPGALALAEAGAAVYLGLAGSVTRDMLQRAVGGLLGDPAALAAASAAAASVCDGGGAARVASRLLAPDIRIRRATMADAAMLHGWRNAPEVRAASFDPRELPMADHLAWMERVLRDPGRHLLVAQCGGEDMGCARFDLDGATATISVYLAPAWLGRGAGSAVIAAAGEWLFEHEPRADAVDASIMPGNEASRRAFQRAGYVPVAASPSLQPLHEVYRIRRGGDTAAVPTKAPRP